MRLLKLLESQSELSQSELAERLGVSLGRTNYHIRALIDKGLVKVDNFQRSDHKLGYLYLLTPAGIEAKFTLTRAYLRRKETEYQALRLEIERLRAELDLQPKRREAA